MKQKIVVVEDDLPILDLMGILLTRMGYTPVLIPDGPDALAAIRSDPPALILLDIMMAPVSGWEFLETLRNEYNMHEIPVILFTAMPLAEEKAHQYHDPHLGILQKPVTYNELKEKIGRFLA